MPLRRIAAILIFLLSAAMCAMPPRARADIPLLVYGPVALTTTTSLPVFSLSGQSTCSMVLSGNGSATLTPLGSSDKGATYTTVSTIGSQSSNGTYGGGISPYLTNYYVDVTSVTGTVTVTESCSATIPVGRATGTGPPATEPTFSAILPVQVATPPNNVTYSCATIFLTNTCLVNPAPFVAMGAFPSPLSTTTPSGGYLYFGDSTHPTASPNGPLMNWSASGSQWWTLQFPEVSASCSPGPDIRTDTNGDVGIDDLCASTGTPYTIQFGACCNIAANNPNLFIENLTAGFTSTNNVNTTHCMLSAQTCVTPTLSPLPPNVAGPQTSLCQGVIDHDDTSTSSGALYQPQYDFLNYQFTETAAAGVTGTVYIYYWCPN